MLRQAAGLVLQFGCLRRSHSSANQEPDGGGDDDGDTVSDRDVVVVFAALVCNAILLC